MTHPMSTTLTSADSHVTEPPDLSEKRMDEAVREAGTIGLVHRAPSSRALVSWPLVAKADAQLSTSEWRTSSSPTSIGNVDESGVAVATDMALPTCVSKIASFTALVLLSVQPPAHACAKREPTPGTGPGPHDYSAAPPNSKLWREGDDGEPLFFSARVMDTCGEPVVGARVQVLHANQDGDHEPDRWRANLRSDRRGGFKLVTVYPGYAGSIPRHIHFIITHPDHRQLVTRLFFKNDPAVGDGIEDLAIVLEEVRRGEKKAWIAGYEFVLSPR